jgi:hypothetical protein
MGIHSSWLKALGHSSGRGMDFAAKFRSCTLIHIVVVVVVVIVVVAATFNIHMKEEFPGALLYRKRTLVEFLVGGIINFPDN